MMVDRPILFLDSGIGGIPYCCHFLDRNPGESVVYLADRHHFPYGKREKVELAGILCGLVGKLIEAFNPKIAVLACNTATLAALSKLRDSYPGMPFVGTVPAVKPAVLKSKTGKIGMLGTELTVNEPYTRELAARFGSGEIFGIAAPELVDFVENRILAAKAEEKRAMARRYLNRFREAKVDALVLGCTHFLFMLEDFKAESSPDIAVFDSIEGISRRVEALLAETASPELQSEEGAVMHLLVLTGTAAPEPSWLSWADRLGFSLSLLEDM